jgi:hypothetical protein
VSEVLGAGSRKSFVAGGWMDEWRPDDCSQKPEGRSGRQGIGVERG